MESLNNFPSLHRPRLKISVRFRIRSSQTKTAGAKQLYIRLSVSGITVGDYACGVKVLPSQWDQKTQCIKGRSVEVQRLNDRLAETRTEHMEILRELKNRYQDKRGSVPAVAARASFQ